MGHVYGAIAIFMLASRIYQVVIKYKRDDNVGNGNYNGTHKNLVDQYNWLDWYSYFLSLYFITPSMFLKREFIQQAIVD